MNSPYFDGTATSQGGNGVWAPHGCLVPHPSSTYCIPVIEGEGGGCVESGPYVNITTNLAATLPGLVGPEAPIVGPLLGYRPRCIRRVISVDVAQRFQRDSRLLHLLTAPAFQEPGSIAGFQNYFEGGSWQFPPGTLPDEDPTIGDIGLHGAGHFLFAGDPGGDVCFPRSLDSMKTNELRLTHAVQVLQLTRRSNVLAAPRHGRPHVVDLAEPEAA